jgi:GNAT superfamily N-acetyltransferase
LEYIQTTSLFNEDLNKAAKCYVFLWNDKPIGFVAILPFPGVFDAKTRVISRIVVLPDFQGLGLGKAIINYISSLYASIDSKMYIRTINPAIGIALGNDKNWIPTSKNMKEVTDSSQPKDSMNQKRLRRLSYSYKYEGVKNTDSTDVITFNADAYKDVAQNQIDMFA